MSGPIVDSPSLFFSFFSLSLSLSFTHSLSLSLSLSVSTNKSTRILLECIWRPIGNCNDWPVSQGYGFFPLHQRSESELRRGQAIAWPMIRVINCMSIYEFISCTNHARMFNLCYTGCAYSRTLECDGHSVFRDGHISRIHNTFFLAHLYSFYSIECEDKNRVNRWFGDDDQLMV